jgi:hypothetical protein
MQWSRWTICPNRVSAAMIRVGDRIFTAAEIDRLHHRKAV